MDAHFYNVDISWKSGRTGEMSSPELQQTVEIATPPQFPKVWKVCGLRNTSSPLQYPAA